MKRKRFRQVIVRASVETQDNIGNRISRCEYQHADVVLSTSQLFHDIQAAQTRKHDIKEHHVERAVSRNLQRGDAVRHDLHAVRFFTQSIGENLRHSRIVFDNEYV
ncbi:MAG TPA: hypothetical protein VHP80_12200 [Candidatus Acidoferrum sp.]|nr:hypothetical protein [Candidatus Acidoferrum sp.]